MKNLMSMVAFVLEQGNPSNTDSQFADKVMAYANFLLQTLEIWMFLPCKLVDGVWVVLERPHNYALLHTYQTGHRLMDESFKNALEYQEAKDRCIFEGFELDYDTIIYNKYFRIWFTEEKAYLNNTYTELKSIEDLVCKNLELTPNALKQFEL